MKRRGQVVLSSGKRFALLKSPVEMKHAKCFDVDFLTPNEDFFTPESR
jgi:hypothetical protein